VPFLAVGELPRQAAAVERALAAREVLGLACRLAYAGRLDALQDNTPALGRMLFEVDGEAIIQQRLDRALHLAVAELRLRLPLELGLGHLHADDCRETLTVILSLHSLVVMLLVLVATGL